MSRKIINETVSITDIEFPNKGIGEFNGNKVTIKNTIPGQTVTASIKKKKQKYEGRVIEILEKAPYEITPKCPSFGICGGCTYQNIPYEKELEIKKNTVLNLLKNDGIENFEFLGITESPSIDSYRNKMEFSFGDTGIDGELSLGMRKRESYYEVVNASNCTIIHSDIQKILNCVLNYFKDSEDTFYHKTKHTGSLRHLLVRKTHFTGEILINLITTNDLKTDLNKLKDSLISLSLDGEIKGILHTVNESVADIVRADKMNILYGNDFFIEKLFDLKFKISIFSFFQTNSAGAEVLYSVVRDFAANVNNKTIFDLYCGTGTIAQIMSSSAKKVIGIEIVEEAIEAAKTNAKLNNITNCEFIAGDVLKMVDTLKDKPNLIILDPPREGIHPKAIKKIIDFNAENLIYISCKASSLAKDLKVFEENGYKVKKIKCVDMFPRTYHVETVVLLSKKFQ